MAGMPVGPLSLNDEVAVDLALKILKATKAQLGDAAVDPAQEKLLARHGRDAWPPRPQEPQGLLRLPRKPGRSGSGPASPTSPASSSIPRAIDMEELKQRLLVTQALEAARTVEEGSSPIRARPMSARSSASASRPITGGTLSYIDGMGAPAFVELCEALAKKHGERFKPNEQLKRMAKTGESYYGAAGKAA